MNQDKEDLDEEESFFELADDDQMFSSWANLLGVSEQDQGEEVTEGQEEQEGYLRSNEDKPTPQTACNLM